MSVERSIKIFDLPFSIIITAITLLLCLDNRLSRIDGAIMLAVFAFYLFRTIRTAVKSHGVEEEKKEKAMSPIKSILFIVIGLAAVVFGGDLVVDNAVIIAEKLGMSEMLISLTIIAMGTSLPELVTSVVAAAKGANGLAMGNVVGSNIFNLLFVLAASVLLNPCPAQTASAIDLGLLIIASTVMLLMIVRDNKYTRLNGATALMMYAAYAAYIIIRN